MCSLITKRGSRVITRLPRTRAIQFSEIRHTSPFGNQEVLKVAYAAGDDGNGIRAFAFGSGTKLITTK